MQRQDVPMRLQVPQWCVPAIRASSCCFKDIRSNDANDVRYKNFHPPCGLPPAPECAELRILLNDAVDFYEFLRSVFEGAVYGNLGEHTEAFKALEVALRPYCSKQLEWLDDGEGLQHIWGPGWMVAYHRFTDRDRTEMIFMDHVHGSTSFEHGDHRDTYTKVAHLGFEAVQDAHYSIIRSPIPVV